MMCERPIGGEMPLYPAMLLGPVRGAAWPVFGGANRMVRCDTGRSALQLALRDWKRRRPGGALWLPDYVCPSVPDVAARLAVEVRTYADGPHPSAATGLPAPGQMDIVLCVHYFGRFNRRMIDWASAAGQGLLLEDCVQAPYTSECGRTGDYVIASLRKWWPVSDGALLATRFDDLEAVLECPDDDFVAQRTAAQLIRDLPEGEGRYLEWVAASEARLSNAPPRHCSWMASQILDRADVVKANHRRRSNWLSLSALVGEGFDGVQPLHRSLGPDEVPLTYVIRVTQGQRDELRAALSAHAIYCPVHWKLGSEASIEARCLASEVLSLPIDQRYDESDMRRIRDALRDCVEKMNE